LICVYFAQYVTLPTRIIIYIYEYAETTQHDIQGMGSANYGMGSANYGMGSANYGMGSANYGM